MSRDKTIYYSLREETLIIFCPEQKFIFIYSWEEVLWSRSLACESWNMYKAFYAWRGSKLKITPVKFMWEVSLNS